MNKKYLLFVFIIVLLFNITITVESNSDVVYPHHKLVTNTLSKGYKELISPINQSSCSMYPTCSQYAKNSFRKDNPVIAWLKTSDRLIRCSNDSENYHRIFLNDMVRFYDPVNYKYNNYQFKNTQYKSFKLAKGNNKELDIPENNSIKSANATLLFDFAKKLEYEKKLNRAIIEYKRLISYYPDSNYKPKAQESVFRLLYKQEKYIDAIKWGQRIIQENNKKIDITKLKYFMGCAYYRLENYNQAIKYFKEIRDTQNQKLIDRTYLLEGLSYVSQEKWDKAINIFQNVNSDSPYFYKSKEFIKLSQEGKNINLKNPKLAGSLAIIPGLGYLYTGYNEAARSSFFVNSLFIWATVQSFENNNDGLGSLLAVFSAGFYSGNIYGSMQTARRKNDLIKQKHMMKFDLDFKF